MISEEELSTPATFEAAQEYLPLSSESALVITRDLPSVVKTSLPSITGAPSFNQVTIGVGTPLTGHLMVMVVFDTADKLSPMFMVTGLPSPIGMFCPSSETSIIGLDGSVDGTFFILKKRSCSYCIMRRNINKTIGFTLYHFCTWTRILPKSLTSYEYRA